MDALQSFAADRKGRMTASDKDLRPLVASALRQWDSEGGWVGELIVAASVLWTEIFEKEAPKADPEFFMPRFQKMLRESLEKTSKPADPVDESQITRIAYWMSTFTVNNATYLGNRAHGGAGMRWITMRDEDVRASHRAANGQIADRDGTFDIGGHELHYPGEPVGPPEVWINCRCILAPARVEGALSVSTITAAATDEDLPPVEDEPIIDDPELDDELGDDEPEEDEDLITEMPVHGIATIEGRPTGDGRQFALGSLSFGQLPQPLGYEYVSTHGGDTSMVAIIGRIDRFETVPSEDGSYNEARWSGVVFLNKAYANEAVEGIIDGSIGGVSVIVDSVEVDVSAEREELIARITAERAASADPDSITDETGNAVEEEMTPEELADLLVGDGTFPVTTFSKARIRRFDMVPTPAYQEAYIAIGDRFYDELDPSEQALLADCGCGSGTITDPDIDDVSEDPEENARREAEAVTASATFAPGTKDGPGWITHPVPTARIRRYWVRGKGAAKIRWGVSGDFNRCRLQLAKYVQNPEWLAGLCANMHKEAIGVWPGQEGGGRGHSHSIVASAGADVPLMSLTASAGRSKSAAAFKDPGFTGPTPVTIEGDRIFGHLASWGVCHIGIQNACVMAPHSSTNYAEYRTGAVMTDEGLIPVGNITMGTGHADTSLRQAAAVEHYDNTGTVVADVASGEDQYGIWVSGLLRRNVTEDQKDAILAAALSGDWRRHGAGMELVAALVVNVPGFPVPRLGLAASAAIEEGDIVGLEVQEALIAAGIVLREEVSQPASTTFDVAEVVRETLSQVRAEEESQRARQKRLAALAPFAEKVRAKRVEKVLDKFGAK